MLCSMSGVPPTLHTQLQLSMTTAMRSQNTMSLLVGMLATERRYTEKPLIPMLAMLLLHKAGRLGTGSPAAMTMRSLHTEITLAAEPWRSLTAPTLAVARVGTPLGSHTHAMMRTHMGTLHQMTGATIGSCASYQSEETLGCLGLTGILLPSAGLGPSYTAGMTEGMRGCYLLVTTHTSMLPGLLMSMQLHLPDLTEMACTRPPGMSGKLLALCPGVHRCPRPMSISAA